MSFDVESWSDGVDGSPLQEGLTVCPSSARIRLPESLIARSVLPKGVVAPFQRVVLGAGHEVDRGVGSLRGNPSVLERWARIERVPDLVSEDDVEGIGWPQSLRQSIRVAVGVCDMSACTGSKPWPPGAFRRRPTPGRQTGRRRGTPPASGINIFSPLPRSAAGPATRGHGLHAGGRKQTEAAATLPSKTAIRPEKRRIAFFVTGEPLAPARMTTPAFGRRMCPRSRST